MGFGGRQGRTVTVTVQSFGEDITVKMRQLSALEVERIKTAHPPPLAPRREVDGATTVDAADEEFRRKDSAWRERFLLLQVAHQIVDPPFDAQDDEGRVRELQEGFTEAELIRLATQAILVGRGDITPAHTEAARQALAPFENSTQEMEGA